MVVGWLCTRAKINSQSSMPKCNVQCSRGKKKYGERHGGILAVESVERFEIKKVKAVFAFKLDSNPQNFHSRGAIQRGLGYWNSVFRNGDHEFTDDRWVRRFENAFRLNGRRFSPRKIGNRTRAIVSSQTSETSSRARASPPWDSLTRFSKFGVTIRNYSLSLLHGLGS